ncbi:MAG: hypothetical protein AAGI38_19370 [Bacteroidota bacterium]
MRGMLIFTLLSVLLSGCQPQGHNTSGIQQEKQILEDLRFVDSLMVLNGQQLYPMHKGLPQPYDPKWHVPFTHNLEEELNQHRARLTGLQEPDYGLEQEGLAMARFIYHRDYTGTLASVTLILGKDTSFIRAKLLKAYPIAPAEADHFETRLDSFSHPITTEQVEETFRNLEDCFFWNLQGSLPSRAVLDGTRWTLEAADWSNPGFSYHKVDAGSPPVGNFRDACQYLVNLVEGELGVRIRRLVQ